MLARIVVIEDDVYMREELIDMLKKAGYPVILAATKGDPDAMKLVLQHYRGYIAHLSMQKIRDESGNTYWGIDEDLRERLQAKLMRAVLNFKAD